jgi:hypothetical protein
MPLEELLEDEVELVDEDELVELDEDVELELELEVLLELDEELEVPLIVPVEGVRVTRSSRAPSSRLRMRSVWLPAARFVKVVGVMVP